MTTTITAPSYRGFAFHRKSLPTRCSCIFWFNLSFRDVEELLAARGGEVDLVEPLGRDDMLIVRAGAIQIHALAPAASGYETGAPVQLKLNTERLHFFDPQTEQSLLWA